MLDTFRPLLEAAHGIDLTAPTRAHDLLIQRLPPDSERARAMNADLLRLLESGSIAERGEPPVKYGRVARAGEQTMGFSIDVVDMTGAGPAHHHPLGEVNWCVALEGDPRFDGHPPGWVVLPPGSTHVPAVAGGRMLIVYLLPEGRIEFLPGSTPNDAHAGSALEPREPGSVAH
ncbi:MAG TPA: DUF4863 family protein [Planctomycetota bacterium]|nr:DUF4863 family protein [Planctomycetota bacterium]